MRLKIFSGIPLLAVLLTAVLSISACASHPRQDEAYTEAELDQMLALIALYPDSLLSQILMASTYPLEVVEAARWSAGHPELEGSDAVNAVAGEDWDASVMALVAFPDVLAHMDQDLSWTQQLGDAYMHQEEDVIDSIQRLRESAYASGYLDNMENNRAFQDTGRIIIEPRGSEMVYLPYYSPLVVYSNWWWPDYPPYYWDVPLGYYSGSIFYWGHGIRIEPIFFFSTFNWTQRHIVIVDRPYYRPYYHLGSRHYRFEGSHRWRHDSRYHRWEENPIHQYRQNAPVNKKVPGMIDRTYRSKETSATSSGRHRFISNRERTDRKQPVTTNQSDRNVALPAPSPRRELDRPKLPEPVYRPSKTDRKRAIAPEFKKSRPAQPHKSYDKAEYEQAKTKPTRTKRSDDREAQNHGESREGLKGRNVEPIERSVNRDNDNNDTASEKRSTDKEMKTWKEQNRGHARR